MPEDTKPPADTPPEGEKQPAPEKPTGSVENVAAAPPAAAKPPAAAPEKPVAAAAEKPVAAAPPKPAAPAKPAGPVPTPWDSPMVAKVKRQFGSGAEAWTYLGQNYLEVDRSLIPNLLRILRDEEQFDYCVDITAVHYPKRERQFDIVWILYSFARNERMRVKTQIADGEHIPSAVSIWPTANWLEREAYDMFGLQFDGHPDLKRILLPDGWKGHPLRKDYDIIQQDQEWVQINLGIESGQ
jgi:NADH-quinone oxidoreductase subunit C